MLQGICTYGISFLISILGARLIEKRNHLTRNKVVYAILILLVVLPPSLLAGIRAETVGVDTMGYMVQYKEAFSHKDFKTIYALFGGGTELVIALLVYLLSLLNVSITGYLFIIQLLTVIPVLNLAIKMRQKVPVSWIVACYLFLFYNNSLNLARQSLSAAWLTLMAANLICNGNKLKGKTLSIILPGIIGTLMHKAGIIGLILITFCCFRERSKVREIELYILLVFAIVFSGRIIGILTEWGVINRGLTVYSDLFITHTRHTNYLINPFGKYGIPDVLIRLLLFVLPVLFMNSYAKREKLYRTLKSIVLMGFGIFTVVLFALSTNYGQRISMYLDWMLIIFIPYGIYNSNIFPRKLYLYAILVTYWLVWIFAFGWSASANYAINPDLFTL